MRGHQIAGLLVAFRRLLFSQLTGHLNQVSTLYTCSSGEMHDHAALQSALDTPIYKAR